MVPSYGRRWRREVAGGTKLSVVFDVRRKKPIECRAGECVYCGCGSHLIFPFLFWLRLHWVSFGTFLGIFMLAFPALAGTLFSLNRMRRYCESA